MDGDADDLFVVVDVLFDVFVVLLLSMAYTHACMFVFKKEKEY